MQFKTNRFSNSFDFSFRMIGHARICAVVAWGLGLAPGVESARAMISCDWEGSIGNWTDGGQWNLGYYPNDGHPDPGDTYLVTIGNGIVIRNAPITIHTLNLNGGTLAGSSTLTVQGGLFWSGGVIHSGSVVANNSINLDCDANLDNGHLTLAGPTAANFSGPASLSLDNQSTLTNSSTLSVRNDNGIYQGGTGQSSFTNTGIFTRADSSGTFTIGVEQFSNTGTVTVNSGTLLLNHGITNSGTIQIASGAVLKTDGASSFNTGSSITGSGQWIIHNQEQHVHTSMAVQCGVKLENDSQISVYDGHTLTFSGALDWSSGTLSREASLYGGEHGFVTLNGSTTVSNSNHTFGLTITNSPGSHFTMTTGAIIALDSDGVIVNAGNLSMHNSWVLEAIPGGNSIINTGTITATSPEDYSGGFDVYLTNSGVMDADVGMLKISGGGAATGNFHAAAGAIVKWGRHAEEMVMPTDTRGGDFTFHAGTMFTGEGTFLLAGGRHFVDASLSTAGKFNIFSDLSIAAGKVFSHGGALYFAGSLSGGGELRSNLSLRLRPGASITGGNLTNAAGSTALQETGFDDNTCTLNQGGVFHNAGGFTARNRGGFMAGGGLANRFENAGSFTLDADDATDRYDFGCALENNGTVIVTAGQLRVAGGGTSTGGTWAIADPTKLEFAGDYSFAGNNTSSGTGLWIFGTEAATQALATHQLAGTMSLATPVMMGNAKLVIGPAASVTAGGALNALLGTLTGGGTFHANGGSAIGNLTVDGATLALGAGADHLHASVAPLVLTHDGIVSNAGSFRAQGDHDYTSGELGIGGLAGTGNAFHNAGTFTRDTGAGDYVIGVPFHNTGTVSAQSGVLGMVAGGSSTDGTWDIIGGLLTLQGDFAFDGTTTLTGTAAPQFSDGVFTINGPFDSASGLQLLGTADLAVQPMQTLTTSGLLTLGNSLPAGPVISGGGTVQASGGIELHAATIDGTTLNNGAGSTATHSDTHPLTLINGGVFSNAGTYLATGDAAIAQDAASTNRFLNSGTFSRNISAGVFTVAANFDNTGVVNTTIGTLSFTQPVTATGGTFDTTGDGILSFSNNDSFDSPAPFTGNGNVRIDGGIQTFAQSGAAASVLTLAAGKIALPPAVMLNANGYFHWAGGSITGTGTLTANGGLDLTQAVSLTDATLVIPLAAAASQSDLGNLVFNGTATIHNAGVYHASNDHGVNPGTGSGFTFNNPGTLVRDTGTGVFTMAVPFHNSGTLEVQTGTFSFSGGGTSTGIYQVAADADLSLTGNTGFSGDSAFTGAGRINLQNGTQTIADSMSSSAIVNLSGGIMNIAAAQTFESAGTFHWSGGTITGGGTLDNTGNLSISGAGILDGATVHTATTAVSSVESAGSLVLKNSAILHNEGTFFLLNDGSIGTGDSSAVAFENSGTVSRDTGNGLFSINIPFNHSGNLNLNSGALALNGGGTAVNSAFHTQSGTALHVGTNYTFGVNNIMTGSGATHFSNGSLHVTGSLITAGSFNWSGGTLDGGGTFTVNGGLNITPGASGVSINGTTLENAAGSEAVIAGSSATHIVNGGTYHNSGLTRLQGNNNFSDDGGGTNSIINSGALIRDGGTGAYTVTLPIHNTGTIRSTSGALLLNAGGSTSAGALDADGGDIYLNGGIYQFSGGVITGSSYVYLTAGTARVTGDTGATSGLATGGFGIAGGTLDGSAMLSVDRGYFANGQITGDVILRLTGPSTKLSNYQTGMSGGTVQNDGNFTQGVEGNWDLDNSAAAGGGTILNRGTWNLTGSCSFANSQGGGVFNNLGTFHQAGGYNWMRAPFHNGATGVLNSTAGYILLAGGGSQANGSILDADGGDIHFYGGTHQLEGGTLTGSNFVYASVGTVSINGNVGAATGAATGGFGVNGATITGTGMLSAERGYFSNGQINGEVVLRFSGEITKANQYQVAMSGGTVQNDGTYTSGTEGNWDLDNSGEVGGGTILNHGTWTLNSGCSYSNSQGGGTFNNLGTFHQAGGYSWMRAPFNNAATGVLNSTAGYILLAGGGSQAEGSILNADGGDIYFYGGTHDLDKCTLTGSGFVYAAAGTVNLNANIGVTTGAATGAFGVNGATVAGAGMLSVERGYLSTGQISGDVVLRFTGASLKENYSYLNMSGGTIRNDGVFTQGLYSNWDLDNSNTAGGGTIQNNGTWNLTNSGSFSNTYGGGVFNNSGILNQSGGENEIYTPFHNMATGLLNADPGAIVFQSGTHQLDGGSLTGNGWAYVYSGTVNITADVNPTSGPGTGGLALYSNGGNATLGGTGMLSVERGYLASGYISGDVVLRMTGESSKGDYTYVTFFGGTIRNEGTYTQASQANYDLDGSPATGGGTLVNTGIWTLTNSSNFSNTYGGGVFNNSGTFKQTGGSNHIYAAVTNSGTIHASGGTLYLNGGSSHTGALVTDSHIVLGAGSHSLAGASARLAGAGVFSGNLTITDGAKIAPGNSPGTLTLYGNVGFIAGGVHPACAVELAGASSYDGIALGDGASLDLGTDLTDLQVTLQYAPSYGDTFRIIHAGGTGHFTGTFRNLPGTDSVMTVTYGAQSYSLGITYDGSGKSVDLTVLTPYQTWVFGKGLHAVDAAFDADPDLDGIANGIEFVIGGEPNPATPDSNSCGLLPQIVVDESYLRVIYRRNDDAIDLNPGIQYNAALAGSWTNAEQDVNGVDINVDNDGFGPHIDRVEVLIPRSNEVAGKLFARLNAAQPGNLE